MNKNLLFSVLGILILIGVTWVLAGAISSIDSVSVNLNGSKVRGISNWTSANESGGNVINFTIATNTPENLTLINITLVTTDYLYVDGNASDKEILNLTYNQTANYFGLLPVTSTNTSAVVCGETANMIYCYNATGGTTTNISGDPGGGGNNLWFLIDANNTPGVASVEGALTWNISIRSNSTSYAATGVIASTTVTAMGIDNLAPRFIEMNVSNLNSTTNIGSRNNNTGGTGFSAGLGTSNTSFIRNDSDVIVSIVINESNLINGTVYLLWNISAVPVVYSERTIGIDQGNNRRSGNMTLNASSASRQDTRVASQLRTFNLVIDKGNLTDQGVLSLAVFANDTFNQTLRNNNSGNGYNVVIDGTIPTATLSLDKSDVPEGGSISITCDVADSLVGVKESRIVVTKASGASSILNNSDVAILYTDTSGAGVYKVGCNVTDGVDNVAAAANISFTVSASGSPSSPSGGGGSGSPTHAPEEISVDIDLTIQKGLEKSDIIASEGHESTFTLDGTTIHKVTFSKVGSNSITITIRSNPIILNLSIGESKEIDVDENGINDLKIRLNSIKYGKADVTIEKLKEITTYCGNNKCDFDENCGNCPSDCGVCETEEITEQEETVTEEVAPSSTNTWITILIIIVVLIILLFAVKKKGTKTVRR